MTISRSIHQVSLGAALVTAVGILASCGGSTSTGAATATFPTKATVNIPKADRFEPFLLQIAAGGTVTWTNHDSDAHTIVSMPTDPVDFKLVAESGKSVSQTFSQPGIYGYYCDAHSALDPATGLIKARKEADAYPISMYGIILVVGDSLPVYSGNAKIVMPSADRFDPLTIAVRKGTQVKWTNLDSDAHTVLTDPTDSVQFKFVAPANGTASYTFDKPGMYPYFCDAHAQWNADLKRVQAREGSSEYPAAMEGVVFVLP
jgi:plastocyanin